jgi:hypothetical protein
VVSELVTVRPPSRTLHDHLGLVHIISAMEACNTYKPRARQTDASHFLAADTG